MDCLSIPPSPASLNSPHSLQHHKSYSHPKLSTCFPPTTFMYTAKPKQQNPSHALQTHARTREATPPLRSTTPPLRSTSPTFKPQCVPVRRATSPSGKAWVSPPSPRRNSLSPSLRRRRSLSPQMNITERLNVVTNNLVKTADRLVSPDNTKTSVGKLFENEFVDHRQDKLVYDSYCSTDNPVLLSRSTTPFSSQEFMYRGRNASPTKPRPFSAMGALGNPKICVTPEPLTPKDISCQTQFTYVDRATSPYFKMFYPGSSKSEGKNTTISREQPLNISLEKLLQEPKYVLKIEPEEDHFVTANTSPNEEDLWLWS